MHHKFLALLLIIGVCCTDSYSQDIILNNSSTLKDTGIIIKWCEKAYHLRYSKPLLALEYALRADSLSVELGYKKGEGDAKMRLGILAKNKQNYEEAKTFFNAAKKLRNGLGDYIGVASCENNLGLVAREEGDFKTASKSYLAGIEVLNSNQIQDKLSGTLWNNLAMIYANEGAFKQALSSIDSSLAIRSHFGDTLGLASSYLNAGNIYRKMELSQKALENYRQSLFFFKEKDWLNGVLKCRINIGVIENELGRYDKASEQFAEILKFKDNLSKYDQHLVYKNLGAVLYKMGGPIDSTLFYYDSALKITNASIGIRDVIDVNYHIGRVYFEEKNYEKSIAHLEESEKLFDSLEGEAPILKMNVLFKLSENYARTNQFKKAFLYNKESTLLQDSLNSASKRALGYKIEYDKMKSDQQLQEEKMRRERIVSRGIIASILAFMVGLLFWFRNQHNQKKKQKEFDEIIKNQEIKVLKARLEGQDTERIRIGQDLHDRLGVLLSTIKLHFQSVEEKIEKVKVENIDQFQKAANLLDDACDEVRKIAHDMQSSTLTDFGLREELKELAEKLRATQQIQVKVVTFGMEYRLDNKMEFELYKIIQELVANTLKHAKASNLTIELNQFDELINIMVADDGDGFEADHLDLNEGVGLKNIQARVFDLHGNLKIDARPNRGTSVIIDIPYQNQMEL